MWNIYEKNVLRYKNINEAWYFLKKIIIFLALDSYFDDTNIKNMFSININ